MILRTFGIIIGSFNLILIAYILASQIAEKINDRNCRRDFDER